MFFSNGHEVNVKLGAQEIWCNKVGKDFLFLKVLVGNAPLLLPIFFDQILESLSSMQLWFFIQNKSFGFERDVLCFSFYR